MILWGVEKNLASWDYLLLSQSISLSDWICHLSKCPEAICFVCNKSPSEGPICLLFSVIPATFLSCALFFPWVYFDDKWLNSTPTVYIFVTGIHYFKMLFSSVLLEASIFVCLTYRVCTKDFLLHNYSYHKLDVLLATSRVALKHLGFFNFWFKWTFASQKCSCDNDVLGEVLCADAISCSLWFCPVLAKGGMLCQTLAVGDADGVCGLWESHEQRSCSGQVCRAMGRENYLNKSP